MKQKNAEFDSGAEKYNQHSVSMMHNPLNSEITKYLLENESNIQTKLMHYRGYYYDRQQAKYVRVIQEGKEMLNEKGIQYANRQFRHFSNKVGSLANLDKKQVAVLTLNFASRVRRHMLQNLKRYRIKNPAVIDEVKNDIIELAFCNLTRSIDDRERRYQFDRSKVVEHHAFNETAPDRNKLKMGW